MRRVELTHDVLCGVVKASRDAREEREAREAAERQLARQREGEAAARRALLRARQVAGICTFLAAVAIAAAVLAYFSSERARRAERHAQETQALAEQARGQAEHLLAYLTDDLARELEANGRLNVLADFAQQQIEYFRALPPALKGPESVRTGALALALHARALRTLGQLDAAARDVAEAVALLEKQRAAGDDSQATTLALATAELVQSQILDNKDDTQAPEATARATALLRPLAAQAPPVPAAQRLLVQTLIRAGYQQQKARKYTEAVASEREAMQLAVTLGARTFADPDLGAYYAEAGGWLVQALVNLGHYAEARTAANEALAMADATLARRPGHRLALHAADLIGDVLVGLAMVELDPRAAAREWARYERYSQALLSLDPDNVVTLNNLGNSNNNVANAYWSAGELTEALRHAHLAEDYLARATTHGQNPDFFVTRLGFLGFTAYLETTRGELAAARATVHDAEGLIEQVRHTPALQAVVPYGNALTLALRALIAQQAEDNATARRLGTEALARLNADPAAGPRLASEYDTLTYIIARSLGRIAYDMGDYPAAEAYERQALKSYQVSGQAGLAVERDEAELSTWLALALARQGRQKEAADTIAPVLKLHRELEGKNRSDAWLPLELALALYAQALAEPAHAAALLKEAAAHAAQVPPQVAAVADVRRLRERIRTAAAAH